VSWLAREATVRRIVDGVLNGRAPVVLAGPGMGRTTVLLAAAERLRERRVESALLELGDDATEPGSAGGGVVLRSGGLELHRMLARGLGVRELDGKAIQRVPLVPLLRRDLRAWAAAAGVALAEDDLERAFRASGGHPWVFSAWLDAQLFTRAPDALEERVLAAARGLFARTDAALSTPSSPSCGAGSPRGRATVDEIRRATGAGKGALDRLSIAGPSRGARRERRGRRELQPLPAPPARLDRARERCRGRRRGARAAARRCHQVRAQRPGRTRALGPAAPSGAARERRAPTSPP
jgi:hypothetical protein